MRKLNVHVGKSDFAVCENPKKCLAQKSYSRQDVY